jgi:uroporphyrinogen-III decarboxylase
VEAQAWGATLETHDPQGVPVLEGPIFTNIEELLGLADLHVEKDGRLPVLLHAAQKIATELPGVPLRIALAGPFSIAVGLFGFETLLMEMLENGEAVGAALKKLGQHQARLCSEFAERGFQVTIYDSGAAPPLVSPDMFADVVAPALRPIFDAGRQAGKPVACIIGGDMAPSIEHLLECGPAAVICPAETDQEAFMRKALSWPEIGVRINLPAELVTRGDEAALQEAITRLAPLARQHPRASLGTGVLPYDANPDLILKLSAFAASLG